MTTQTRPKILIACNQRVRQEYLAQADLQKLETIADWTWFPCEGGGIYDSNTDPETATHLREHMAGISGLVVCHGAPKIDATILDVADQLTFIGELEGDRFASRVDLEAAWAKGITTVDTTNASSYPVAEWALGLLLICLRNGGAFFRNMIQGQTRIDRELLLHAPGTLTGKRVGLIGCGHMGRHLLKLLEPFQNEVWVYDPYLPSEMPEALGFLQTTLTQILSQCDIIVCLAPLTPGTRGMLGEREFDQIRPGTVFINVSRGPVVDSQALLARLQVGDIIAGLDVFDPEPVPPESELIQLSNVFLSPHIGYYCGHVTHFFALMVEELQRHFHSHQTYFALTPRSWANRQGSGRFAVNSNQ